MPWVRPVSPSELKRTVRRILPDAEVWTEDDDDGRNQSGEKGMRMGNGMGVGEGTEREGVERGVEGMRRALRWAAGRMGGRIGSGDDGGGGGGGGDQEGEEGEGEEEEEEKEGLVVVAGSLYLVADFYRLMGSWREE